MPPSQRACGGKDGGTLRRQRAAAPALTLPAALPPAPQMYALLAICTAMCPTTNRLLDEAVANTLREK